MKLSTEEAQWEGFAVDKFIDGHPNCDISDVRGEGDRGTGAGKDNIVIYARVPLISSNVCCWI